MAPLNSKTKYQCGCFSKPDWPVMYVPALSCTAAMSCMQSNHGNPQAMSNRSEAGALRLRDMAKMDMHVRHWTSVAASPDASVSRLQSLLQTQLRLGAEETKAF